jgi:hypothetical protein
MATRRNRRNRKSRGGGIFSQGLRSFGISVGDSTSEATKQIVNILTSARLTEDQKRDIRSLLPARTEDDTFYENLNRDLGNAGINAVTMTDILMLFPPKPHLPSLMQTI